jgi:chorismate dehydratase
LKSKIKVGAVSYLNTKPLLYGIEQGPIKEKIELTLAYPAQLAQQLNKGEIDLALMPIAALEEIKGAKIVGEFGIAAHGNVVSVALFSQVPLNEIKTVLLDYQSRTSVRLTELLFAEYWEKEVKFFPADADFIDNIKGSTGGVIIGDRALEQLPNFKFNYDLSAAWKNHTGLPFVFAAWVSNKDLSQDFLEEFNAANEIGLSHLDEIADANHIPYYNLKTYYKENICYPLGEAEKKGLALFLEKINAIKIT